MRFSIRSTTVLTLAFIASISLFADEECHGVRPRSGDIGIGGFLCVGGACSITVEQDDGSYEHWFTVEPRIEKIDRGSPADEKLREGDTIVAVDGFLVTTREGGRRLAELRVSVPVTLRVRRGGKESDVVLVPEYGCNVPELQVLIFSTRTDRAEAGPTAESADIIAPAPVEFGMSLECRECGWKRVDGQTRWFANDPPLVTGVVAGGPADIAGVRRGDILVSVEGHALTNDKASELLGSLRGGEALDFIVRRGNEELAIRMIARASSARL